MVSTVSPSARPISRGQIGKFCDILVQALEKSDLPSDKVQLILEDCGSEIAHECILSFRKHIAAMDSLITVDRSFALSYPSWMTERLYSELESRGKTYFNITTVKQWLHHEQGPSGVSGEIIHEHLIENDLLRNCLGQRELQLIKKRGPTFFNKYFHGKTLYGWKSAILGRDGVCYIPALLVDNYSVVMVWYPVHRNWREHHVALMF